MAEQAVEAELVLADGLEEGFLANGHGARCGGFAGDVAALGADDGNLPVALDGVREADAVFDDGAVAGRLEVDVKLVLDRGGRLADFNGSKDSIRLIRTTVFQRLVAASRLTA